MMDESRWVDAHDLLRLDHSQPQVECGLQEYDSSSLLDGMECAYAETINQSIYSLLMFIYILSISS